jgi:hypothetical protein
MYAVISRSRVAFAPACSAKKSNETPINVARKNFEKKRVSSLKENVNTLLTIANADVKQYTEFFKELDELHKKELKQFVDKVKSREVVASSSDIKETSEEDNIFLDKE